MATNFKIIEMFMNASPCYTNNRRITPRGVVTHSTATPGAKHTNFYNLWNQPNPDAGVHYIIDDTGIYQLLPENRRSWHAGSPANDYYISYEICEPGTFKYNGQWERMGNYNPSSPENVSYFNNVYEKAVWLSAYLCKKYGWIPDKNHVLCHYEVYQRGEGTCHIDVTHWFPKHGKSMDIFRNDVKQMIETGKFNSAPTPALSYYRVGTDWQNGKCMNQAGAYTSKENAVKVCGSGYKVFDEKGKIVYTAPTSKGTQPSAFAGLSESQAAAKILALAKADYQKTGILASVTAAQMILESGYVKTDLAVDACNCFGMKTTLSNNSWKNSTWDGKSKYTKITNEEYTPGIISKVTADFRRYPCIEDSISDHSAYLLGAKNGDKLRYAGLKEAKDYNEAITIIKNGGYATDSKYIDKICNLIKRFELDKYDGNGNSAPSPAPTPDKDLKYKVGQYVNCSSYYNKAADPISKAVIKTLSGTITATKPKKANPYQIDGKYWCNDGDIRSVGKAFEPYNVKVNSGDVNIRSNAGTNYASKGFTGIGTFGIVEEKKDSQDRTWGLLKTYQKNKDGWVALWLDCVKKV
ncbi:glucosaminidase domain-containing protein [Robinsoniella peoriensis]|uniref:glucosaminidase domain-containing protein n=1 Tax=Robinsoniella peoriensis TaxID=180332 RepID=UPI0006937218|nr:glucosaminidase domain-containing protein [Robinsoniella peoriensis]